MQSTGYPQPQLMLDIEALKYALSSCRIAKLVAMFFMLVIPMLAGCFNNSATQHDDFVTAYPITVPMRPGELENVLFSSTTTTQSGYFDRSVDVDEDFTVTTTPCHDDGIECWTQEFSASASNSSVRLGFYQFNFTGNGFLNQSPEENNGSYLPFSIFPATTQALPPATRFAAGGYLDRESLLLSKFSDEPAHSLSVAADGTVWAWGDNLSGQLGNGNNLPSAIPVQVEMPVSVKFVAVAAGGQHSLALADDGSVWAWGYNAYGQLGDISKQNHNSPVQVPELSNVTAIAAGDDFSLALLTDGTVQAWGADHSGQLGNGSFNNSSYPGNVTGLSNIIAISAGSEHALALSNDGTVYGWGNNESNQVNAQPAFNQTAINLPQAIMGGASAIATGARFSLLLKSNGTVWSWGDNNYAQLGHPTSQPCTLLIPSQCDPDIQRVSNLDQVLDIDAGERFAIARRSDGSVWAWGDNNSGQIAGVPGLGTLQARQVSGLSNIIAIAAGRDHALAMSADEACSVGDSRVGGRLLAWGNNMMGTRGDGTAVNWFQPTPVVGIGDDNSCSTLTGQRLMIYLTGTGEGSVQSDQPGMNCVASLCWQSISTGSSVTLTATPVAGSVFKDWQWDCAEQPQEMSVVMDSVRLCKVRFDRSDSVAPPQPYIVPGPACADGQDNDGDGLIDVEDPGCSNAEDDSEINQSSSDVTLTITINGSGEVFDNNDANYACYSESTTSCTQTYSVDSIASLRGISFGIEDVAIWTSGCDNGSGMAGDCQITMDSDKTVTVSMQ